jgi:Kef-type K+ transport system membrane component KefB/mannitol/fructose-specific phosphotransferase system IIA component (Ntr-type)/nucleotide-binding universal stress UspA family protein
MFPIQDPILTFTFLMLTILVAPMIANRLRVPDLILLLGCGALLGPNGLGMIERNQAITMFGSIGLLYIMFTAGLEIDLNRFARTKHRTIVFGLLTFSIPQTLGTLMGHYLLGFNWITSILLGSMFASHTLLAYPIASRLGISRNEPVVVTVGGTIITDTLALLVLAVIADSARGADLGAVFWLTLALGMAVFVGLIVWGVPRLTTWFFSKVTESGGAQFLFVLCIVCGCSYLAHFAKMEPIIGAFLAGAAFNRLIPRQSALMNRLSFVGNTLFIPFFLIFVGMLVDPRVLVSSPRGWLVIVSITGCILLAKYAAADITRRIFNYTPNDGKVIFGLSVVQAAATLATVIVGYNLKLFDDHVLNGAIISILVSCPLGAWVVDRYGRKVANQTHSAQEPPTVEQRLLVSIANPAFSLRLLNFAFLLRDKGRPGNIYPVAIASDPDNTDDAVAKGEKLLGQCLAESSSAEMKIIPSIRVDLNPSDGLIRAAQELRATQVLAGWSQRSLLESRLFGTVSERLLESCPTRLLFCHLPRPLNITKRVLMPLPALVERRADFAELLRDAKHLSRQVGATLRVYIVSTNGTVPRRIKSARPECPVIMVESKTWTEAQSLFLKDISSEDMVLLPGERRTGTFWTPALDKLQRLVFSRFPQLNLLCSYPPLPQINKKEIQVKPSSYTEPEIFPVDLPPQLERDSGLQTMIRKAFENDENKFNIIMPQLRKAMNATPLALTDNVALIHAHSNAVFKPTIIIGKSEKEWYFDELEGAYRILFVLLSPEHAAPENHLKVLSSLARNFLDPDISLQARNAASAEDVEALLLQNSANSSN